MGAFTPSAVGRDTILSAVNEATYKAYTAIAAGDAMRVLKADFKYEKKFLDRVDARATRSLLQRFEGKRTASWSAEMYSYGSGAAGTAHDYGLLLAKAFGVETPGASVIYSLSDSQTALGSMRLSKYNSAVVRQDLTGAWVETFKASADGGNEPHFMFEGGASELIHTGGGGTVTNANIAAAGVAGRTTDPYALEIDSVVQIGTSVGGGTGHRIATVNYATGDFTFTPGVTGQQNIGVDILPYTPVPVVSASNVITGIVGSFSLDAVGIVPIIGWEFELHNGIKPVDNEAFQSSVTDYVVGWRAVKGSFTIRARRDMMNLYGRWKNDTSLMRAAAWTCGNAAGNRFNFSVPRAQIDNAAFEIPEVEEGIIKLPWVALGNAGGDECTLTSD